MAVRAAMVPFFNLTRVDGRYGAESSELVTPAISGNAVEASYPWRSRSVLGLQDGKAARGAF